MNDTRRDSNGSTLGDPRHDPRSYDERQIAAPARRPCAHSWIDPTEAPITGATYAETIGPGRREMKYGREYVCRECGLVCKTPRPAGLDDAGRPLQGGADHD
jgi:hypothetical protein